jgi:LysR family nitrogen assimilation transcriptional regulator
MDRVFALFANLGTLFDAMNSAHLQAFVLAAEFGSLSKAAAYLNVSQPALSRQIRRLEEETNTTLVIRHGRGIALTEAGANFLENATEILKQMDFACRELAALKSVPCGVVTMGLPPSVGTTLVPSLITKFRTQYPSALLRICESASGNLFEGLVNGRLDIAIIHLTTQPKNMVAEELLTEDLYVIGSPGDPLLAKPSIPLKEIAKLPLYLPERTKEPRKLLEEFALQYGVSLRVEVELDSAQLMKVAAGAGEGYAILPFTCVQREVMEKKLSAARLYPPPVCRTLYLVTTTFQPLSMAARALANLVHAEMRELHRAGTWISAPLENEVAKVPSLPRAGGKPRRRKARGLAAGR